MKSLTLGFVLALSVLTGCSETRPLWHDQRLPSGHQTKVTSFHLVWGAEHDERRPGDDSFALEFVAANPQADPQLREQEALEVFELIRPVSELWGFDMASLAGFATVERKGTYDLYIFRRGPDGKWTYTRSQAKVFANE